MVNCFICKSKKLKRPISRIPIEYPEKGNKEFIPVCRKCAKKYFKVIVFLQNNPGLLNIKYIPIPK